MSWARWATKPSGTPLPILRFQTLTARPVLNAYLI